MQTIVQDYGPIYGEVVNGTVQGRPNGSVYVPISNTISLELIETYRYIRGSSTFGRVCTAAGNYSTNPSTYFNAVAKSQDLANNMEYQLYSDADCTVLIAKNTMPAGIFNGVPKRDLIFIGEQTITADEVYYLKAQLLNNSTPVANSEVIELVGVEV